MDHSPTSLLPLWAKMLSVLRRKHVFAGHRHRRSLPASFGSLQQFEQLEQRALLTRVTGNFGGALGFDISQYAEPSDGGRQTFSGMAFPGSRSDPEASARTLLNLVDSEMDYELVEVKQGLASSHTRFRQMIDGVPVFGSSVSAHQGADGAIQTLHMQLDSNTGRTIALAPELSADDAIAAAMRAFNIEASFTPPKTEQVWYRTSGGDLKLSWQVDVTSVAPAADIRTVVDATSGELLFKVDRIAHATGTGDVFLPNPYQTQGNGTGLDDDDDATSAALDAQLVSVTLQRLDEGTGLIKGQWVDLSTLNSPTLPDIDANEPDRVYEYTRDDDRFEQVVIYQTVDAIQEYFHTLGFDDDTGVANGIRDFPTLANAHWDNRENSFYLTGNDTIHFGDGGVDDGEDADIIAHEYGHAVQHDQNANWGGGDMGAMGEGFGDYLAASFFADTGDAAYQAAHAACVGEWDATAYSSTNSPCLRRVDGNKMYPDDLNGSVHDDGEIWSAALWDLRTAVGAAVADTLVLEHHFALPANATMPVAAEAIITADANLNSGENEAAIRLAFGAFGILAPTPPGTGRVSVDRERYGIGETITVTVVDRDLAGDGSLDVVVTSTGGESEFVTLTESNGEFVGTFVGTFVAFHQAVVQENGTFEAASGDQFTVTYEDATDTAGNPATVTAEADLLVFEEIVHFDFSDESLNASDEGFVVSGTNNEWHLSTRRGSDPGHSVDDSFYFGNSATGEHGNNSNGTITSPVIDLTGATVAELMFNHFLESEAGFDFATLNVIHDGGTTQLATSRSNHGLPTLTSGFENIRFDLAAYRGQSIQLAFRFDSDADVVNEGWYVDDVIVRAVVPDVISDGPDLTGKVFDVANDHVQGAQAETTFTVSNDGNLPAGSFETHVVWSPNNVVGDRDDIIVPGSTASFTGLAAGANESRTMTLMLNPADLYAHAVDSVSVGQTVGTESTEASHLFLIIDAEGQIAEQNEVNNSGVGRLTDSDDITYFPWDLDGNGAVSPLDALAALQSVGTANAATDFDGNGVTSPFEAYSAIQRIGYVRNSSVIEYLAKAAAVTKPVLVQSVSASMPAVLSLPVEAYSPSVEDASSIGALAAISWQVTEDDERTSLFRSRKEVTQLPKVVPAELQAVDQEIPSVGDWLDAI